MRMPRIWEILNQFKDFSRMKGWRTCESQDWVEADGNYHNFLWTRDIHLSSFKKVASNGKCVVREGLSYRVVETSFCAWLFSQPPSENLIKTVVENPVFSGRIALYDLSQMLEGKNACVKLNQTDSLVFREFESFLENELKIKLEPMPPIAVSDITSGSCTIAELA